MGLQSTKTPAKLRHYKYYARYIGQGTGDLVPLPFPFCYHLILTTYQARYSIIIMCFSRSPEEVFNAALVEYVHQTGNDLAEHPLSAELENSKSPSDILNVIGKLAKTFHRSKEGNKSLVKALEPTVNVVCSLSGAFGNSVGLVRPFEMACLNYCPLTGRSHRHTHQHRQSSAVLVFSLWSVSPFTSLVALVL